MIKNNQYRLALVISITLHLFFFLSLFSSIDDSDFIAIDKNLSQNKSSTSINYKVSILRPISKNHFKEKKTKTSKSFLKNQDSNDIDIDIEQKKIRKDKTILEDYIQKVVSEVEKNKFYPEKAKFFKVQGLVEIEVQLHKTGKLINYTISKTSNSHLLDHAATDLLENISQFPAIPSSLQMEKITIIIPIHYKISN